MGSYTRTAACTPCPHPILYPCPLLVIDWELAQREEVLDREKRKRKERVPWDRSLRTGVWGRANGSDAEGTGHSR